MILDVVRHGVTAANVAGHFSLEDEPLLESQFEQLRSAEFRTEKYERIYVSPLRRCIDTARALGMRAYEKDARLSERNFGVFGGLTPSECLARHREAFEAFSRFDADFAIPEGESRSQHYARVASWLDEVSQVAQGRVLVVSHGGTIDFLYRLATGRPLHGGEEIYAGQNTAVSSFRVRGSKIGLIGFSTPLQLKV
jgi:2,3-bisphosphoglycerate-dependent phosphoglycerate mutase